MSLAVTYWRKMTCYGSINHFKSQIQSHKVVHKPLTNIFTYYILLSLKKRCAWSGRSINIGVRRVALAPM